MLNILGNLLGGVVNTVGDVIKKDQAIKEIKQKGKLNIAQAKIDLAISKLQAQVKQQETQAANDMSYDMQVLKNRRESIIDEIIIVAFIILLILTFIPATQATMAQGWKALNDTAWWFEFGIVGILVSTLGLKDVLRIFIGGSIDKLKKKTVNDQNITNSKIVTTKTESNINQSNLTPLEYDLLFDVTDTLDVTGILYDAKNGFLCINNNQYRCVSGMYGLGALPKGMYKINKCYKLKPIKGKTEPYTGWEFPWIAKLTPQFKTNRSKLLIHPDGGVEGTRGCIGIKNKDSQAFDQITNLLKVKKELILYVNK